MMLLTLASADGSDRQVEFVLNAAGKPESLWIIVNGIKAELKKIN
jgi:hypothetical protein